MKKGIMVLLLVVTLCSIIGCGKQENKATIGEASTQAAIKESLDENDPEVVLMNIADDFVSVIDSLLQKEIDTFAEVGVIYPDYAKNKGLIDEWVNTVLEESDNLFARTRENAIVYFKLIANNPDHKYSEFCEDLLDKFYDTVYEDAMDEYYDNLYEDALEDLYDAYYDGIIYDAQDDMPYKEWSDARSESYRVWSDARSAVYKKWSKERSYLYGLWSAMNSAFCWNDNFDVDAIVAEYDEKKAEEDAKRASEEAKVYVDFEVVYKINSEGDAEVVGYQGEGNRITISSEYEGEDVVRIAEGAFEDCTTLESVIMWAEVEEIGDYAFAGCTGLTEFSISSDTEVIGNHAFEGCSNLKELYIWGDPDIGDYAFADCVGLPEISISSSTDIVGAHAFEGCTGVTDIYIWGCEIIGDYAFAGCTGIEEVSIPSEVHSVGNHAFDGCRALTSVYVWGDDTAIGKDAFANCPSLADAPASRGVVPESVVSDTKQDSKIEQKALPQNEIKQSETAQNETKTDLDPAFKEAMDSYEKFVDEYVAFMKKYMDNPGDLSLLSDYADYMTQYADFVADFESWEDIEMGAEEAAYYIDVQARVTKKLLEIAM